MKIYRETITNDDSAILFKTKLNHIFLFLKDLCQNSGSFHTNTVMFSIVFLIVFSQSFASIYGQNYLWSYLLPPGYASNQMPTQSAVNGLFILRVFIEIFHIFNFQEHFT